MLSKRLKTIISLIPKENNIIDVGTDHAYIPIYLRQHQEYYRCLDITASDVNKKVLEITKENINKYNLTDKINVVLSNGLEKVSVYENTTAIIAGMGFTSIKEILKHENAKLVSNYIIQSNNQKNQLRLYFSEHYLKIEKEILLEDKKKYYNIFFLSKGKRKTYFYYNNLGILNKEYATKLRNKHLAIIKNNSRISKEKLIYNYLLILKLQKYINYKNSML